MTSWIKHDKSFCCPIEYSLIVEIETWIPLPNARFKAGDLNWTLVKYYRVIEMKEESKSALTIQVEGSHYKNLKIQPVQYAHANNIPFIEGNIIKYVTRWREKNGIKDLEKAKHFIDLLIELEGLK